MRNIFTPSDLPSPLLAAAAAIAISAGPFLFPLRVSAGDSPAPLLRSGDTVALIGNTFVERARLHGEIETALLLAPGPDVTGLRFRNLGWSGDSVFGDARSYFGKPEEGRTRLAKALEEFRPQVALLCYGTGAALSVSQGWTEEKGAAVRSGAGLEESLALFAEGYRALLDLVAGSAGDSLREIVLLSPPPLENLGDPLPDQTENNQRLARFRDAIRDLAEERGHRFVDLFAALGGDDFDGSVADPTLTENGVHYTADGYRVIARRLAEGLGYPGNTEEGGNADATAAEEELKAHVIEKNRLFFHRWRPANETYLYLFRKHEQGQNASEIPMFDPLIDAEEKKIEQARGAALR